MKAKKEYVIVGAQKLGSDTYFYTPTYDNGNGWLPRADYKHRYATIELAKKALEQYLTNPICFSHISNKTPIVIDNEKWVKPMLDYVWSNPRNNGIFIVRVPSEYYIGKNYKELLKYKREKRYNDDKRYQLRIDDSFGKKKTLWLKIANGNIFWVKSRWDATFFNKEDVDRRQDNINKDYRCVIPGGYYPYVRIDTLPYHIVNEPKFNKWDIAYYVDWEHGAIHKGTINDIFLESRKRWNNNDNRISFNYEFSGNTYVDNPWEDKLLTSEEFEQKYQPKDMGYINDYTRCYSIVDLCGRRRKLYLIDDTYTM